MRNNTRTPPAPDPGTARILRAEGAAALAAALLAYAHLGLSWWLFAALILAPDLAMLGYLRGPRLGAALYNAAHTYVLPVLVGIVGWWVDSRLALGVALILVAHVGFDRAMGYGLKLPQGFRHTHLGRIGRGAAPGGP
ncbi:MAG TPA: DUF4260 domain-containing protein [Paracoccaceae bacterium]|nr:DUF4260 domain-containing protein [Paracoccaceae bacterium]